MVKKKGVSKSTWGRNCLIVAKSTGGEGDARKLGGGGDNKGKRQFRTELAEN